MNRINKKNWKSFLPLFFVFLFFATNTFSDIAKAAITESAGSSDSLDATTAPPVSSTTTLAPTTATPASSTITPTPELSPSTTTPSTANSSSPDFVYNPDGSIGATHDLMAQSEPVPDGGAYGGATTADQATTQSGVACTWNIFSAENLLNCMLFLVMSLVKIILLVAAAIFSAMIDVTILKNTLNAPAVYQLWSFVRDFINMFFVLILLFSAFATIFQISKYNFKNILFKLILAALLVNFSFTITRVIIDVSNIAFYSFIQLFYGGEGTGNGMLTTMTDASGLVKVLVPDSFPSTATLFAADISFFLLAISFLALGVLMLLRLIFLVVVIIFSPLAFISLALSNAGGFFNKWSNLLLKYSFFGPIMMFFFYVGIQFTWIINQVGFDNLLTTARHNNGSGEIGSGFIASLVTAFIPVVVIWLGMAVANSLSIQGAEATMGRAQKLAKWAGNLPVRGTKWSANAIGHRIERDVLAPIGLSPKTFKDAWKARQAELDTRKFAPATGIWRDRITSIFSLGKEKTRYGEMAFQNNIAQKEKELAPFSTNSEFLFDELGKSKKDKEKTAAILRLLFLNNDQNEFMKLKGLEVDPFTMKEELIKTLSATGMKEEMIAKQLSDLSEIAVSKGNFANYGMAYADPKTGKYHITRDNHAQAMAAAGKATNIKAQTKMDLWHWNSMLTQNADGSTGHLHETGEKLLRSITGGEVDQTSRLRPDFVLRISERLNEIESIAEKIETGYEEKYTDKEGNEQTRVVPSDKIQADLIRKFAKNIKNRKEGKKDTEEKAQPAKTAPNPELDREELAAAYGINLENK